MDIPYVILDSKNQDIKSMISELKNRSLESNSPVAILVKKILFLTLNFKPKSQLF